MRLGEVCKSVSQTFRRQLDEVVLINTSDVLDGTVTNHVYVPNENLRGQFKKSFRQNDILYSEIRPKNRRFAFVNFDASDYVASTKLMVIRSNELVLPEFLFQVLKSDMVIDQLQLLAETRSGTFPQITFSELAALDVRIPSIDEQREIAGTLQTLDDKITNNSKINHHLEQMAQAIFKSWFVDFEPFDGEMPSNWRVVDFSTFLTPRIEKSSDPDIPLFSVTDTGIYPRGKKFNKNLSKAGTKNKIARKTDLVFGMSREILNWGVMRSAIGGVSSAYNVFAVDSGINSKYLESFINAHSLYFKDLIRPATREGQGVDKGALMLKSIYLPPDRILADYYVIEDALTEQMREKEAESARLTALRDTLLPRLMSGELSSADLDAAK